MRVPNGESIGRPYSCVVVVVVVVEIVVWVNMSSILFSIFSKPLEISCKMSSQLQICRDVRLVKVVVGVIEVVVVWFVVFGGVVEDRVVD